MIRAVYPDLTALWHGAARKMLLGKNIGTPGTPIDWLGSSETYTYSNVLRASSMAYDFDLGRDLSLNRSRFTTLVRAYLHPVDLNAFLNRAEDIGNRQAHRGVVTTMNTRQKEGKSGKYQWGPCMLAYTFRGGRKGPPPTLALHSRTAYLSYIGGADLALCHVVAREISEAIDIPVEEFQFEWYLEAGMTHGYKQIPFSMKYHREEIEDTERYPTKQHPTLARLRREWNVMMDRIDTPLEDEKWGARRRCWRRFREMEAGGGPPSCPLETLSLEALYR